MASEQTTPETDPILSKSLSWPLAIASLVLIACTVWTLYDEVYGSRPYIAYQSRFAQVFPEYLASIEEDQAAYLENVKESKEYRQLASRKEKLEAKVEDEKQEIDAEIKDEINPSIAAITPVLQDARARVSALIYQMEEAGHHGHEEEKEEIQARIVEIEKGPFRVRLPDGEGGTVDKEFDYPGILAEFQRLKDRRDELTRQRTFLLAPANEIGQQMQAYLKKNMPGLTPDQIEPMKKQWQGWFWPIDSQIQQIHVADVGLVDRCESCHLAIRAPLVVRADNVGGEKAFTSHPRREILEIHDPDNFGCSPCHGGNGMATTSVDEGHGRYKHWLWPLHGRENMEAGCLQCHEGALRLEHATTFNQGAELFRHLGCWGCHPRANYDRSGEEKKSTEQQIQALDRERFEIEKEILRQNSIARDRSSTKEQVIAARQRTEALNLTITGLQTRAQLLGERLDDLTMEDKEIAPSLLVSRAKLKPGFLPYWIGHTKEFRPTTRMPQFRVDDEQIEAISAYIWQNALDVKTKSYEAGDAAKGQALFETRGCQGCHGLPDDSGKIVGATFAAELSRVGEKAHYDYLVGWILNPATSGDTGVVSHTVMPSLRLTTEEARDVATYLVELSSPEARKRFDETPKYLSDSKKAAQGKELISHFGCFACHQIAGFEDAAKIGTELTKEGSKPIERLDFALFTSEAKKEGWYDHKGFFERKLDAPAFFDEGKYKPDFRERLKMPEFNLRDDEVDALTTFLLGSVDSRYPSRFYHQPDAAGQEIRTGWWIVQKYNCTGCHQIVPGEKPPIQDLDQYAGEKSVLAPPSLVGEGARVAGEWLARFLRDPGLGNAHGNGVRPYLAIRMPTFELSNEEIVQLIRFFDALSGQPTPYIERDLPPLAGEELDLARIAFVRGDCLKCHVTDLEKMTADTVAPSFLVAAKRLKPRWTGRWIIDPWAFAPGTKMPRGLFARKGDRWVLAAEPKELEGYSGDHVDLFLRYMRHMTEEEAGKLEKAQQGG